MSYGTPISAVLPEVQDRILSPGPTFAEQYNAVIQEVMNRLGTKIGTTHIEIASDLAMRNQVMAEIGQADLADQEVALSRQTYPRSIYRVGRDFYVNDGRGRTVRLTADGVLDASGAAGVAGSGYGASGVEIAWNAGTSAYRFKSGAGANAYAGLRVDGLRLNDGSDHYMSLRAPTLAANYDIKPLGGLPAAGVPSGVYGLTTGSVVQLYALHQKPHYEGDALYQVLLARAGMGTVTPGSSDEVVYIDDGNRWFLPIACHVGQRILSIGVRGVFRQFDTVRVLELNYSTETDPRYTIVQSMMVSTNGEQTASITLSGGGKVALDARFYGIMVEGLGTGGSGGVRWWSRARTEMDWPAP